MTEDFEDLMKKLNEALVLSGINVPASDLVGRQVWMIPKSVNKTGSMYFGTISSVFFTQNDKEQKFYCPFGFCLGDDVIVYWEEKSNSFFFRSDNHTHPFLCDRGDVGRDSVLAKKERCGRCNPYRPVELRII